MSVGFAIASADADAGDSAKVEQAAEEAKVALGGAAHSPFLESVEENVVSKNSFCILIGAFLRKHAVSPKNVNIKEYEMLLSTYKPLFKILLKDNKGAQRCFEKANVNRNTLGQDAAQLNSRVLKPAMQQYQGFLAHLGAYIALDRG